jgi:hypothetical protein
MVRLLVPRDGSISQERNAYHLAEPLKNLPVQRTTGSSTPRNTRPRRDNSRSSEGGRPHRPVLVDAESRKKRSKRRSVSSSTAGRRQERLPRHPKLRHNVPGHENREGPLPLETSCQTSGSPSLDPVRAISARRDERSSRFPKESGIIHEQTRRSSTKPSKSAKTPNTSRHHNVKDSDLARATVQCILTEEDIRSKRSCVDAPKSSSSHKAEIDDMSGLTGSRPPRLPRNVRSFQSSQFEPSSSLVATESRMPPSSLPRRIRLTLPLHGRPPAQSPSLLGPPCAIDYQDIPSTATASVAEPKSPHLSANFTDNSKMGFGEKLKLHFRRKPLHESGSSIRSESYGEPRPDTHGVLKSTASANTPKEDVGLNGFTHKTSDGNRLSSTINEVVLSPASFFGILRQGRTKHASTPLAQMSLDISNADGGGVEVMLGPPRELRPTSDDGEPLFESSRDQLTSIQKEKHQLSNEVENVNSTEGTPKISAADVISVLSDLAFLFGSRGHPDNKVTGNLSEGAVFLEQEETIQPNHSLASLWGLLSSPKTETEASRSEGPTSTEGETGILEREVAGSRQWEQEETCQHDRSVPGLWGFMCTPKIDNSETATLSEPHCVLEMNDKAVDLGGTDGESTTVSEIQIGRDSVAEVEERDDANAPVLGDVAPQQSLLAPQYDIKVTEDFNEDTIDEQDKIISVAELVSLEKVGETGNDRQKSISRFFSRRRTLSVTQSSASAETPAPRNVPNMLISFSFSDQEQDSFSSEESVDGPSEVAPSVLDWMYEGAVANGLIADASKYQNDRSFYSSSSSSCSYVEPSLVPDGKRIHFTTRLVGPPSDLSDSSESISCESSSWSTDDSASQEPGSSDAESVATRSLVCMLSSQ